MQFQSLGGSQRHIDQSQIDTGCRFQVPDKVPVATTGLETVFLSHQPMASKRGSKHPGVTLIKPDAERGIWWRVRYEDPETGRLKKATLDPSLRTTELRVQYAKRLSQRLSDRRRDILLGAATEKRTPIDQVVGAFYEARKSVLREGTLSTYRHATERFLDWAKAEGIQTGDDLRDPHLERLKDWINGANLTASKRGAGRGVRQASESKRSAHTVNRELRTLRTVFRKCKALGLMAHVTSDGISEGLRGESADIEAPSFFRAIELKALVQAALKHDSARFELTREEHLGLMPAGSTWRHVEVGPYLVTIMLTGMRRSEGLQLRWEWVDLESSDADGNVKGDIHLPSAITKTKRGRQVDLGITPLLHELLTAIRPSSGKGLVFPHLSPDVARKALLRLRETYGAPPDFDWQGLRRTCSTFQVNAASLFGTSSSHASSRRLGHSPAVADRHYAGLLSVSRSARTLEEAMGVATLMPAVIESAKGRRE